MRKMFVFFILPMYITFGLGSTPEMPINEGGLFVISFSEKKSTDSGRANTNSGIVLFDFEV